MDPRLLRHYNEELAHLRETGAEFAREFPKIASRLSLDGLEVADPYVERLLEGFAFLAARTQVKLDAEHPRLIQHLLETVYPGFLSPVPSMTVLRLHPDPLDPNLAKGFTVPRGSALHSEAVRGQATRCEFRTAHDVNLWPIEISAVSYFSHATDLPLNRLPLAKPPRGGLRIKLKLHGELKFSHLPLDTLALHIAAPDDVAFRLHELLLGNALGSCVIAPGRDGQSAAGGFSDADSIAPIGFDDKHALLPETLRGFSGHRLLQELAALPQRFLFFELRDLARRLARVNDDEAEIVLLFGRADPTLEALVDASSLALYCTPAINLFSKRLDRIHLSGSQWEHHAVPDRTRPMDYEVHSIESVTGHGVAQTAPQRFMPLYASFHDEPRGHGAFYTVRREPRLLSPRQRTDGPRASYIGQEVFVSLVDRNEAPCSDEIRQLSLTALVSNRDLPLLLPGTSTTWTLDAAGPAGRIETLRPPTRPVQRLASGDVGWAMVSALTMNHLSLLSDDPARAATTLRALLSLHGPEQDAAWTRQVDSIQWIQATPVVRRLPFAGPLTFGSGVQVTALADEMGFQGSSAFLMGCVLEHLFARHAAANSFCETVMRSTTRGEILHGRPRVGAHAAI